MKVLSIVALASTCAAVKFIDDLKSFNNYNMAEISGPVYGLKIAQMRAQAQQHNIGDLIKRGEALWPHGRIDDGTDDDKILNYNPEDAPKPVIQQGLKNFGNIRPAIPGQWPPG